MAPSKKTSAKVKDLAKKTVNSKKAGDVKGGRRAVGPSTSALRKTY